MKTTSFILPKYIYELLKGISEEEGIPMSLFVRRAVRRMIEILPQEEGVKGRESLTIKLPEAYIEVTKKSPFFITMGEFLRLSILLYLLEKNFGICWCMAEPEEFTFTEEIPPF